MSVQVDEDSGRVTYLGTGIADLKAAKRHLRRKFRREQLGPVERPTPAWLATYLDEPLAACRRFYVSVAQGSLWAPMMGPYASHLVALMHVPEAKVLVNKRYHDAAFVAVGTCSTPDTLAARFGRGEA